MSTESITLYSYWRSSACYRVRIALHLKGLEYETIAVHLVKDGGEQHLPEFREVNPQELIPVLRHGDRVLRQSLAIMEYLDETWPDRPLLPAISRDRQRVRTLADIVACDIHPLGNLRVLQYLEANFGASQEQREQWLRHWIGLGFAALETTLAESIATGKFCEGDSAGLADCCLVPQVYNARRVGLDMAPFPTIVRIDAACQALDAFKQAAPEAQPDAS